MRSLRVTVLVCTVVAIVGLWAASSACADTLPASADVSIFKDKPGETPGVGNFGADVDDGLCIYDIDWSGGTGVRSTQRTLMQFNLSAYNAGSVQSAVLHLYVGAGDQSGQVLVYGMTQPWVEGTGTSGNTTDGADWFTYNGSSSWGTAGGDYNNALIASTFVSINDTPQWYSWDVTSLVKNWVNGAQANYGFMLASGNPDTGDNASLYSISSRESSSNQPYLEVVATPEPMTMSLLAIGGIAALLRRRASK